jgi:hypothetical protein
MLTPWSSPLVHSSAGAAHRRRGQPCQDASLVAALSGADGTALTLMAVADGHGAPAYRHSAVGSAAACRVAREVVAEALAQPEAHWRRPDPGGLDRWLGRELPAAIRRRWLEAIRRHWRGLAAGGAEGGGAGSAAEPFAPRPYGTTLGLVLLTPDWWAYTGLGDWDLVRIDADGARLLSQEEGEGGGGEATASLAAGGSDGGGGGAPFPFRWRWFALDPDAPPFALVLSTDGIRKSCASDADFLALASWLATGMAAPALEDSLERISREGCGDDVSVAIVRWGALGAAPPRPAAAQLLPTTVGPQASGGGDRWGAAGGRAVGGADPSPPGGADSAPGGAVPASGVGGRDGDRPRVAAVAPGAENGSLPGGVPPAEERAGSGRPGGRGSRGARGGSPRPGRPAGRGMEVGLAALAGLAAVGAAIGLRLPQRLLPAGDPLVQEVERLCASPGLAAAALASRRSQFEGLRQGRLKRSELLAQRQRDPLGALIASSFQPPPPTGPPAGPAPRSDRSAVTPAPIASAPATLSTPGSTPTSAAAEPSVSVPTTTPPAATAPPSGSSPLAAPAAPPAPAPPGATATAARRAVPGRPCPALNQALDSLWARSAAVPPTDQAVAGAALLPPGPRLPGARLPGLGRSDSSGAPGDPLAGSAPPPAGQDGGPAAAGGSTARQEAAIRTVSALYGALARGDGAGAAAYLGAGAADQFAPAQFRPYARLELEALEPLAPASDQAPASGERQASGEPRPGRDAAAVTLVGVVRLVDRDGRIQRERRTFRVEQEGGMARVTASAFGAVLEPGQSKRP